jgi:hypothetical protein
MKKLVEKSISLLLLVTGVSFAWNHKVNAQVAISSESRTAWGSKNTFAYQIQSTYGVNTSANVTSNLRVENEAVLNLQKGSFVTNKFGDENGNASAVFSTNATGANVDLKGITGENQLLIDNGTTFKSIMRTVDNPDPTISTVGNASATATHTSTLMVEKGENSFFNTFNQSF